MDHDSGPQNELDQLGDTLLRTAAEHDPQFTEPDDGQRIKVVLDQGEHPYLAVRAGAVCYLLDSEQRLWRLDQRAGRTEWRIFTKKGTVRLHDAGPFELRLN